MRMITLAAAGAALVLASPAGAQVPTPQPAPPTSAQQAPASAPAIKTVSVVAVDDLPEDTRNQVNQIVASRTADQMQRLQQAIEGAPVAKSALEAKGFSSRDVLIAQIDDAGELTLVTRKTG